MKINLPYEERLLYKKVQRLPWLNNHFASRGAECDGCWLLIGVDDNG